MQTAKPPAGRWHSVLLVWLAFLTVVADGVVQRLSRVYGSNTSDTATAPDLRAYSAL